MDVDLTLPSSLDASAAARGIVRDLLAPARWDPVSIGDVQLIVTELVTNAFRHGHGTVRLRLNLESDGLTGEVVDEGTGFEREVRAAGADVVGGRGLLIVSALVREWGIHEGSSHVWFEVGRGPTPETTTEPQLGEAARPDEL